MGESRSIGPVIRGNRGEQTLGVGMGRAGEQPIGRRLLHDLSGVHHRDPIGPAGHDAEVVGDEQDRHAVAVAQPVEHLEDLRLHRDVERGRRLVGDQDLGLRGQRDRDHHPLPHAAAELVRVGVEPRGRIGDPHLLEQLQRAPARLGPGDVEVGQHAFGDLVAHGEHRVEAGHRILEDHADPAAPDPAQALAFQRQHVGVAEPDAAPVLDPPRRRNQPEQREAGEALPAAGLADQREGLAPLEREAHPVHRIHPAGLRRRGRRPGGRRPGGCELMRLADRRRRGGRRRRGWPTAR